MPDIAPKSSALSLESLSVSIPNAGDEAGLIRIREAQALDVRFAYLPRDHLSRLEDETGLVLDPHAFRFPCDRILDRLSSDLHDIAGSYGTVLAVEVEFEGNVKRREDVGKSRH